MRADILAVQLGGGLSLRFFSESNSGVLCFTVQQTWPRMLCVCVCVSLLFRGSFGLPLLVGGLDWWFGEVLLRGQMILHP